MPERLDAGRESRLSLALRSYYQAEDALREAESKGDVEAAAAANQAWLDGYEQLRAQLIRYAGLRTYGRCILGYEAEDIAQDVLASFHATPPKSRVAAASWLRTAVRNRITDLARKEKVRENIEGVPPRGEDPERQAGGLGDGNPAGDQEASAEFQCVLHKAHSWIETHTKLGDTAGKRWLFEHRHSGMSYDEIRAEAPEGSPYRAPGVSNEIMYQHVKRYWNALARALKHAALEPGERDLLVRILTATSRTAVSE